MRTVTIRQALQHVADNPVIDTDELVGVPVHELVCRTLFEIANSPTKHDRGSMAKANVARKMIFDRLSGRRRAGSHPATRQRVEITFVDLAGELER